MLTQIFKWYFHKIVQPIKLALKKYFPKSIYLRTSVSDRKSYSQICLLAAQSKTIFKIFKKHKDYNRVLEHVTRKQGQAYLKVIKKEGKILLKHISKFKENDKYGAPITFPYRIDNKAQPKVVKLSPTTLRYIKVLVDLKNVLPLAKKYLAKLKVKNLVFLKPKEIKKKKKYDLIISNYAFSECGRKIQDEYIRNVLKGAKRGYITYNYKSKSQNKYHPVSPYSKKEIIKILSKNHKIQVLPEKPKTGPTNFIITWNDVI